MVERRNALLTTPGTPCSHSSTACWIDGYERRGHRYEPLVRVETTGSDIVTWGEFVETRLIAEYRSRGVAVVRMRPAIMTLREESGPTIRSPPLARSSAKMAETWCCASRTRQC